MEESMAAEYERVELDEPSAEARFTRSDYAQVLFHNIAETYVEGRDLECRYTITSLLTPTGRDWVALYKVGWSSAARDYVIYNYAPMPDSTEQEDKDQEGCVTFQASKLPKDDGEFYQFCYVAGSGQVRGASTPFQFVSAMDEFIEIEDEDNDIMVIRSRTAVLEDDLSKALEEEKNMKKTVELLERERDSLLRKIVDLQRECDTEKQDKEEVQRDLKLTQEKVAICHQESAEMASYVKQLNEKLVTVKQEKESIEARMIDNDGYVISLRDKIKDLVNTKDALVGRTKNLEEEKDMYKSNFSSSESTLTGYKVEIDNLKKRLSEEERNSTQYQADITSLRAQLVDERKKVERHLSIGQTDKSHIHELTEKLRNSEDKLLAAEQCKQMLNKELDTQQQAYMKISGDMEKAKSEVHSLKVQIGNLEKKGKMSEQSWREEHKFMQGKLDEKTQENEKLQQEMDVWRRKMEEMESEKQAQDEAPMFALQMAQKTLKDRVAKKQKENEELKKMVDDLMARKKSWEQSDLDAKREIVELKEHLLMGKDAFRDKYIECQKLRADLKSSTKLIDKIRSRSRTSSMSRQVSMDTQIEEETAQMAAAEDSAESKSDGHSQTSLSVEEADQLSNTEVISQLDNLAEELEKRKASKNKYKQQLQEEKEKNVMLQKHYHDELTNNELIMETERAEWKEERDVLQQRNVILQNHTSKAVEVKECLEKEIERLMRIIEQHGQNTQPPPPANYNYPQQHQQQQQQLQQLHHQSPGNYPSGEAALAPMEPLPLRFGRPSVPVYPPQQPPRNTGRGRVIQQALLPTTTIQPTLAPPVSSASIPLPPPLEPELTADAKKAALLAAMRRSTGPQQPAQAAPSSPSHEQAPPQKQDDDDVTAEDIFPDLLAQQPKASAPPLSPVPQAPEPQQVQHDVQTDGDDDRFMDAQGEPQQMCPVCQMIFPPDTEEAVFMSHIESHYPSVCPVCSTLFDENSPQNFQRHVESHFDD